MEIKLSHPVNPFYVTYPFAYQMPYGPHKGIDLRTKNKHFPRGIGTPVFAPAGGVVTKRFYSDKAGLILVVNHGDGFITKYMHLEEALVNESQKIVRGQIIAHTGDTGKWCWGAHLHFQLEKDGKAVDPVPYFKGDNILNEIEMTKEELLNELDKRYLKKDVRINFDEKDGSVWIVNHEKRYKVGTSADDVAVIFSAMAGEHLSDEERNYEITKDRTEVLKK